VKPYDIDAPDAHNELAMVDYVEDIYRFYKSVEVILVLPCTHSLIYNKTEKQQWFPCCIVD
jgi:hypothetical protein